MNASFFGMIHYNIDIFCNSGPRAQDLRPRLVPFFHKVPPKIANTHPNLIFYVFPFNLSDHDCAKYTYTFPATGEPVPVPFIQRPISAFKSPCQTACELLSIILILVAKDPLVKTGGC